MTFHNFTDGDVLYAAQLNALAAALAADATAKDNVLKAQLQTTLAWTRGRVPAGQNPDDWASGDERRGIWDAPNTSAANALASAGFTFPAGVAPVLIEHVDDPAGIGASVQRVTYITSSMPHRVFERRRTYNQPFGDYREVLFVGGESNSRRGLASLADEKNPEQWGVDEQGVWDFRDIANLTPAVLEGYRPPWGAAAHILHQYVIPTTDERFQLAIVGGNRHRMLWRQRRYARTEYDGWQEPGVSPLAATDTSGVLAIGDSWVEGGENGALWTDGSEWPAQLAPELGVTVHNAGKGGAGSDEILLRLGGKKTLLKITGGVVPASGSAPVELSWTPSMQSPRWFSLNGTIHGATVALEQNGTTGAWTIRRLTTSQAAPGQEVPAAGWVEWMSELDDRRSQLPIIVRVGNNDLSSNLNGTHPTVVDHTVATLAEIIESRPYRAHSAILLGLAPHVGVVGSRDFTQEVNARLKQRFPRQFWDVLAYMQDTGPNGALADCGITPTQNDLDLIADGFPPKSLYSATENVHPSKAFHAALAHRLALFIQRRGLVSK